MKSKFFNAAVALVMVVALFASAIPASADGPPDDYKPVDVGPELREWEATPARIEGGLTSFTADELDASGSYGSRRRHTVCRLCDGCQAVVVARRLQWPLLL